jgi:hypothetical protein
MVSPVLRKVMLWLVVLQKSMGEQGGMVITDRFRGQRDTSSLV